MNYLSVAKYRLSLRLNQLSVAMFGISTLEREVALRIYGTRSCTSPPATCLYTAGARVH